MSGLMDYLTPRQLSELVGVTKEVLHQWRVRSQGPPWYRVGGAIRYRAADVDAWIASGRPLRPLREEADSERADG